MPGRKQAPRTRAKFLKLVRDGVTVKAAADAVGITERTGWRWKANPDGGRRTSGTDNAQGRSAESLARQTHTHRIGDPKDYSRLSDLAKRMIAPDGFPLFLEQVFGWEVVPWEVRAVRISVEAILDKSQRHYGVCNQPPGSGKTSLWTLALPAWLNVGGGFEDPATGRRMRFQLGHAGHAIAKNYVRVLSRLYETPRPFFDPKTGAQGKICLPAEFGRLRPLESMGDVTLWQNSQFVVAQLEDIDLTVKDPTVMAVAPGMEYIGSRCEYASWDDLVTTKRSVSMEAVAKDSELFQKEAEQRIEPGGILWLVGQRINSIDLFRDRLDDVYMDDDGIPRQKYFHIVFPAHHDQTCDGQHRQWDAAEDGTGCLLDARRLPWKDLVKVSQKPFYRTLFQQEDIDPGTSLVTQVMLDGGTGMELDQLTNQPRAVEYPGCWNRDRGWGVFPKGVPNLVNYVTVDPAAGGRHPSSNWAIEWWACAGLDQPRYLIWGHRLLMQAGDLLDWDPDKGDFTGWMQKLQVASIRWHQPIRCWVIEANSAQKHLFQYRHFRSWQERWPFVEVIPHETQRNKTDQEKGVQALIRRKYRSGLADLPGKSGVEGMNFLRAFTKELMTYGSGGTTDTVMADWFGEARLEDILRIGRRPMRDFEIEVQLPQYLERQRRDADDGQKRGTRRNGRGAPGWD
jgi:hypothetical protein